MMAKERRRFTASLFASRITSPMPSQPPRPFIQEDMLKTAEVQIERKFFMLRSR
jgi:hypothetical protein